MGKLISTTGFVLKRTNYGDGDRFVTLFTKDLGKIQTMARGVRKLSSRKRPALEPLNLVKVSLVNSTKTPLIAEAQLIASYPHLKSNMFRLTQAVQLLEIIDQLLPEDEAHERIFSIVKETLTLLELNGKQKNMLLESIKEILVELGFGLPAIQNEQLLKAHLEEIIDRPLRTKDFYWGV